VRISREKLERALRRKGWPAYRLAQEAGVGEHRIYRSMCGRVELREGELEAIARELDVEVEELAEDSTDLGEAAR